MNTIHVLIKNVIVQVLAQPSTRHLPEQKDMQKCFLVDSECELVILDIIDNVVVTCQYNLT